MATLQERLDLSGRVAIVTGAGRGLGLATATALAGAGAAVVIAERDEATGPAAAEALQAGGATAEWLAADVRDATSVDGVIAATLERFRRIDILVNNAGGTFVAPALEIREKGFNAVLGLNLGSTWLCSQAAAKAMVAAGRGGAIVNVASINAFVGSQGTAAYGTAKAAIAGLTRALAVEWGEYGIRVNAVAPGVIATEGAALMAERHEAAGTRSRSMERPIPLGRRGYPEEIGCAIAFLASDLSSYVTGQTLIVDGGATIA
jgi:NAD(P)-dependent dehydrogenase (short-subunit alcohol dehydrogenase family)